VSLIAEEFDPVSNFFFSFLFLSSHSLFLSNNPLLPKNLQRNFDYNAQSLLAEIRKYYANQKKAAPLVSEIDWRGKKWTDENLVNAVSKMSQQEREAVTK
jgi:hypothetical protein